MRTSDGCPADPSSTSRQPGWENIVDVPVVPTFIGTARRTTVPAATAAGARHPRRRRCTTGVPTIESAKVGRSRFQSGRR